MDIKVAGYQMSVHGTVENKAKKIGAAVNWAAENGAEILLTPEGSLSGYTHEIDRQAVEKALDLVTKHARGKNVGLALGTCFIEKDEKCYNQIRFYRPDGEYLGFHSKTLNCGTVDGQAKGEIEHYSVSKLRTFDWRKGICIGGLICNDLWANPSCTPMPDPHLTQQLSAMGANIIFHAVNGGRGGNNWSELCWQFHVSNLRMRAQAGKLNIVTTDNAYPETLPCSSLSGVVNQFGEIVCRAEPKGEQFFLHTITL